MNYPTVYSNIYDLVTNEIYLYNYHNFDEYYKIDINKELDENGKSFYIPSIFSNLQLKEPRIVSDNQVELTWQGNADRYLLYISETSEFDSCKPIEISGALDSSENKKDIGFLLVFLVPVCFFSIKVRVIMQVIHIQCTNHNWLIIIQVFFIFGNSFLNDFPH